MRRGSIRGFDALASETGDSGAASRWVSRSKTAAVLTLAWECSTHLRCVLFPSSSRRSSLTARLPILYSVLALPSFGNFGTRELTWAASFSDFAPHDTLVAYALATNAIFLMLHVVIGVIFLPRAIRLITEMRRAQRAGEAVRVPILRKTSEP